MSKYFAFQISNEQVKRLTEHCKIDNFKKNNAVNLKPEEGTIENYAMKKLYNQTRENFNFIRKGQVGDWMNHFENEEKLNEFDQWIADSNELNIPIKYQL